jgi:RNA polymerase sigma factor (sigma-70 family)
MAPEDAEPPAHRAPHPGHAGRFMTTRWSMVLAAGERATPDARDALAHLCSAYWYPIYAYVRRQGHGANEAQDLTQSFFVRLLDKHVVEDARRDRGRFRSFLLGALKHFLANEWRRERAEKRGGNVTITSIDAGAAETRYVREPSHTRTAEEIYERRWALTLLDNVLRELESEFAAEGKTRLFEQLKVYLTGDAAAPSYADAGAVMDMSEGAVKVAVHRLRQRYKALLRQHIAQTVADESEVDAEIAALFAALAR